MDGLHPTLGLGTFLEETMEWTMWNVGDMRTD